MLALMAVHLMTLIVALTVAERGAEVHPLFWPMIALFATASLVGGLVELRKELSK